MPENGCRRPAGPCLSARPPRLGPDRLGTETRRCGGRPRSSCPAHAACRCSSRAGRGVGQGSGARPASAPERGGGGEWLAPATASLTWRTAWARRRAVRSAAVAPSPKRSDSHASDPLKSAPVTCCTRSIAPPRPCWARWSNHFPAFRTRRKRDVEAFSLPAVALGLVLLEAEGFQHIGQGQDAHAVRNAFLLDQRFRSARASGAPSRPSPRLPSARCGRSVGRGLARWWGDLLRDARPAPRPTPRVHQDARGRSICNGATGAAIWP